MTNSQQKEFDDLIRICETMAWFEQPQSVGQKTASVLVEALECDCVSIHLLDITGDYIIRWTTYGEVHNVTPEQRYPKTTGRMLDILETHKPIITNLQHPDPIDQIPAGPMEFKVAISIPILVGDDVLGMYNLVYRDDRKFSEQYIDYLIGLGKVMGISVQHAMVARKTTDLEILLERKRLSVELHDNLSQLVSLLNIGAETALLSLDEGDMEKLRGDILRFQKGGQETARILREEMLSLRESSAETAEMVQEIKESLQRFEQQWAIQTDLQLEQGLEPLVVSKHIELQFMRILHEALSNVLRHAKASRVNVHLYMDADRLCMEIQDNGNGFDPEAVSHQRLGLRIMRERAASLEGNLTLKSNIGEGTSVCVDVQRYTQR